MCTHCTNSIVFRQKREEREKKHNKIESENNILLIADGCKNESHRVSYTKQNDHIQLFVSIVWLGYLCLHRLCDVT